MKNTKKTPYKPFIMCFLFVVLFLNPSIIEFLVTCMYSKHHCSINEKSLFLILYEKIVFDLIENILPYVVVIIFHFLLVKKRAIQRVVDWTSFTASFLCTIYFGVHFALLKIELSGDISSTFALEYLAMYFYSNIFSLIASMIVICIFTIRHYTK